MSIIPDLAADPGVPLLRGIDRDGFAFPTLSQRVPVIVSKIVNRFNQERFALEAAHPRNAQLSRAIASLNALKYDLQHNRTVTPLNGGTGSPSSSESSAASEPLSSANIFSDDALAWWNTRLHGLLAALPSDQQGWFDVPWLFAECFVYRKVREVVLESFPLEQVDPFRMEKEESLVSAADFIRNLSDTVLILVDKDNGALAAAGKELGDIMGESISELLYVSLWGNKMDLSLHANASSEKLDSLRSQKTQTASHILADHSKQIVEHLLSLSSTNTFGSNVSTNASASESALESESLKSAPESTTAAAAGRETVIDIVLDNSGVELMSDLTLVVYLLSCRVVDRVRLHMKRIPWFVSDVTQSDFDFMIDFLRAGRAGDAGIRFGNLVSRHVAEGRIQLRASPYWTTPDPYWTLPRCGDAELLEDLASSQLFLFKGDLNMRKLIWDAAWPHNTPFKQAIGDLGAAGWKGPTAVAALRALKADCVAGLDLQRRDELVKGHPDWMVSGEFAVILFTLR